MVDSHGKLNSGGKRLQEICQCHLLDEKWLIAPSLRVGRQLLDRVTLAGTPVINCLVLTMTGMAMRLAHHWMRSHDLSFLNIKTSVFVVDKILGTLHGHSEGFFSKLAPSFALSNSAASSISSLRLAGVEPDRLQREQFGSEVKYEFIAAVYREYIGYLHRNRLLDYAGVIERATKEVQEGFDLYSDHACPFIVMDCGALAPMERRLVDELPPERTLRIGSANALDGATSRRETDEELIARSLRCRVENGACEEIHFFSAVGEANEVREIVRRCLSAEIPLDEVEVIHTDTQTYVPLIYETLLQLLPEPSSDTHDLPATFAEGLPASYSRPGKALKAWIAWMREGYPQALLVHMIEEGVLRCVLESDDEISFLEIGRVLRGVNIGLGRERYLERVEELLTDNTLQQDTSRRDGQIEYRFQGDIETLHGFLSYLLSISDLSCRSPMACLENAKAFISHVARSANEFDNYAGLAIVEELELLLSFLRNQSDLVTFDIWEWLEGLPDQTRVLGSGPRPGFLHVSDVASGGHSGRENIFIVGLDDQRFPCTKSGDPLLLDEERLRISSTMETSHGIRYRELQNLAELLARQTGKLCLSYSCRSLGDDSPRFPSSAMLTTCGIIQQTAMKGMPEHSEDSAPPVSFVARNGHSCCSWNEWRLREVIGREFGEIKDVLSHYFPHVERGFRATESRAAATFTAYDGQLDHAPRLLDPTLDIGPVLSTSMLETMAKCPLSYFFKYVLAIEEPREPGMETSDWLDHLVIGRLLHEVFHTHIVELIAEKRLLIADRDAARLFQILDRQLERYKKMYPTPSLSAFERQRRLLWQACSVFLVEEEIACRTMAPRFAEISIGLPAADNPSDIDQHIPEEIETAPGRSVRIRGRVDRIDASISEENDFIVWDYKTGGTFRYRGSDTFHQGRNLQHAVYLAITSALLKKRVSPRARVTRFGYYFPGSQGRGIRLMMSNDVVDRGLRIIHALCGMMASGTFPATNDSQEDCTFCPYSPICGDVDTVAAQSQTKLENCQNEELEPFRLLRSKGRRAE